MRLFFLLLSRIFRYLHGVHDRFAMMHAEHGELGMITRDSTVSDFMGDGCY